MKNQKAIKFLSALFLLFNFAATSQVKIAHKRSVVKMIKTLGTSPDDNVHCGFQDRAGDLWFGTTGEGVYRYNGKTFTNYITKDGLLSNTVWCMLEDKSGNILFGTKAGLCRYDGKTFTRIPISVTPVGQLYSYAPSANSDATDKEIFHIFRDKSGIIWLATGNDGVYRYDGTAFTRFLHNDNVVNKSNLRLNAVSCIMQDKAGDIWFSSWFEGICRYDGTAITSFRPNGEVWFAGLAQDKSGNIWAGRRDKGVCYYDGSTFTNVLQHGIFDSCGLGPIAVDKAGKLWFGTEFGELVGRDVKGGVWLYDPSAASVGTSAFTNFTKQGGLSNNAVFSITIDKSGTLWFGTRGLGLCSFDGKTFTDFSPE